MLKWYRQKCWDSYKITSCSFSAFLIKCNENYLIYFNFCLYSDFQTNCNWVLLLNSHNNWVKQVKVKKWKWTWQPIHYLLIYRSDDFKHFAGLTIFVTQYLSRNSWNRNFNMFFNVNMQNFLEQEKSHYLAWLFTVIIKKNHISTTTSERQ